MVGEATKTRDEDFADDLRDPHFILEYLRVALEGNGPEGLAVALRRVLSVNSQREPTKEEIVNTIRAYVEKSEVAGITFEMDGYFGRSPYAFHIGVRPSRYPRHRYVLYDELAALAQDIAEGEKSNVFFVVGEPQEVEDEAEVAQAA